MLIKMHTSNKNEETSELNDQEVKYSALLETTRQKSQEFYDKAILTLSGGALGVTISIRKDFASVTVATAATQNDILTAWYLWVFSIIFILSSYFFSIIGIDHALSSLRSNNLNTEIPGGVFDIVTQVLNFLAGVCFVAGCIVAITYINTSMDVKQ